MILSYQIISLNKLLEAYNDEEKVQEILNKFECINNTDVEKFLYEKAILFDKQSFSKTHLVYTSYKNEMVLVGYFTLANKNFVVKNSTRISKTQKRKVAKFGQYNDELKQYVITAPLIGQLGKNDKYRELITGDVLLKYACDEVRKVHAVVGGKYVYLECEDNEKLLDFYKRNGFVIFGRRELERDEQDDISGRYLVQLLKELK